MGSTPIARREFEFLRHDANDDVWVAIQYDCLSQFAGIARETPLSQPIAQDNFVLSTFLARAHSEPSAQ
jgi:hypothetical protein